MFARARPAVSTCTVGGELPPWPRGTPAAVAPPASHPRRTRWEAAPAAAAASVDGGWPWAAARGHHPEDRRNHRVVLRRVQGSNTQGAQRPGAAAAWAFRLRKGSLRFCAVPIYLSPPSPHASHRLCALNTPRASTRSQPASLISPRAWAATRRRFASPAARWARARVLTTASP